jgi:hypothetical protein
LKKQEKANRRLSWYHKRNFTLHLVDNAVGGQVNFPDNQFQTGSLFTTGKGRVPAGGGTLTDGAFVICAISLRGQDRFRFSSNKGGAKTHNGYCWDGVSTTVAWEEAGQSVIRLQYFSCDVDFVGAPHRKRGEPEPVPIGYYGGEPIYSVKRSDTGKIHNVDIPITEAKLPDYRYWVPLSD